MACVSRIFTLPCISSTSLYRSNLHWLYIYLFILPRTYIDIQTYHDHIPFIFTINHSTVLLRFIQPPILHHNTCTSSLRLNSHLAGCLVEWIKIFAHFACTLCIVKFWIVRPIGYFRRIISWIISWGIIGEIPVSRKIRNSINGVNSSLTALLRSIWGWLKPRVRWTQKVVHSELGSERVGESFLKFTVVFAVCFGGELERRNKPLDDGFDRSASIETKERHPPRM